MITQVSVRLLAGLLLNLPVQAQTKTPDFDGSGTVDLNDFFLFAVAFGSSTPADVATFDLDDNGVIDLEDFFRFAEHFGETVSEGPEDQTTPSAGDSLTVTLPGGATMQMVWTDPGKFLMGSPSTEVGRDSDEGPQHEVTITKGFYLGKYELTQGQWQAVMGSTPWTGQSYVQANPDNPAVYVSWNDSQEFIKKLNAAAGDSLYRLPTEAEWEYACRAGTTTRWSFGDDQGKLEDYAWHYGNAVNAGRPYAHKVGTKLPNPWGLYDMHGNVVEWVQD